MGIFGNSDIDYIIAPQYLSVAAKSAEEIPLKLFLILVHSEYDCPNDTTPQFPRPGVELNSFIRRSIRGV
jgi:hypothetical protein